MGLSARTRTQIAAEGLVTPDDFVDFNEEADLEGLFKILHKPPKVMVGVGAAAVLTEVAAYVIPAKTMIRMHGVRLIMAYYRMVGRVVVADDILWPVVKSFVEQWNALLEKKKADVGQAPKLTKDRVIYKWLESFQQYLSDKIGDSKLLVLCFSLECQESRIQVDTLPLKKSFASAYRMYTTCTALITMRCIR